MLLVLMVHGAQGTAHIGEHTDIRQTIFQRDGDGRVADEQAMHGIASFRRLVSCDVGNCRSNKTHRVVERPAPTPAQIFRYQLRRLSKLRWHRHPIGRARPHVAHHDPYDCPEHCKILVDPQLIAVLRQPANDHNLRLLTWRCLTFPYRSHFRDHTLTSRYHIRSHTGRGRSQVITGRQRWKRTIRFTTTILGPNRMGH